LLTGIVGIRVCFVNKSLHKIICQKQFEIVLRSIFNSQIYFWSCASYCKIMSFRYYISNTNLLPPWIITIFQSLTCVAFALTLALKVTGITKVTVTVVHCSFKFWLLKILSRLGSEDLQAALVDAIFTTQMLRMHEVIHCGISW
jgi:hypothetical protein